MRTFGAVVLIVLFAATMSDAQSKAADVKISVSGTESNGNVMTLDCDFNFVSVPSNVVAGACRIELGGDRLSVISTGSDRQRASTLLLDGRLTIRALADTGTRRFSSAVFGGHTGFPIYVEIDPLHRDWLIRSDVAGGSEMIASGALTSGRIVFAIP